jgi:Lon protease-like protein
LTAAPARHLAELPLFPLQSVLFPGGRLSLKIFEVRYLDLMSRCLRDDIDFGVVCLKQGGEVRQTGQTVRFESVGVLARLRTADSDTPGVLNVLCEGGRRFEFSAAHEQADGLWVAAHAQVLAPDEAVRPDTRYQATVDALIRTLPAVDNRTPGLIGPQRKWDDAGWVANRWCELLPIPLAARQQLMALNDPQARLGLVHQFLRDRQVI